MNGSLNLKFEYFPEVFDPAVVESIATRVTVVLEHIATDPDRPLARLDLLTDTERHDLAPVEGPVGGSIRTLPDISPTPRPWTPTRSRCRSPSRGHLPRTRHPVVADRPRPHRPGCGTESYVALGIPRSVESVLAVWAVTKTGAAFVPIDPNYPPERIEHMLADSGPASV